MDQPGFVAHVSHQVENSLKRRPPTIAFAQARRHLHESDTGLGHTSNPRVPGSNPGGGAQHFRRSEPLFLDLTARAWGARRSEMAQKWHMTLSLDGMHALHRQAMAFGTTPGTPCYWASGRGTARPASRVADPPRLAPETPHRQQCTQNGGVAACSATFAGYASGSPRHWVMSFSTFKRITISITARSPAAHPFPLFRRRATQRQGFEPQAGRGLQAGLLSRRAGDLLDPGDVGPAAARSDRASDLAGPKTRGRLRVRHRSSPETWAASPHRVAPSCSALRLREGRFPGVTRSLRRRANETAPPPRIRSSKGTFVVVRAG